MTDRPNRSRPTVWRTLRTPEGTRTTSRLAMQSARAHAELWYQALREWETKIRSGVVMPESHSSGGRMVPVAMGQSSGGNMGSSILYAQVNTPLGWLSERAVSQAMLLASDPMLEPIKKGAGLASLADERGGWHPNKRQAVAYAVAVLTVAQLLGDPEAGIHLLSLNKSND
ncbi:hypothetical protein ACFFLM_19210 [Deinococcus oregonensis]|uniref:Uncharacterized protein n=1 Tax=Deinococcus oregonensis TaxID=1805970 RepID=A0ABV6B5D4_9DEIO